MKEKHGSRVSVLSIKSEETIRSTGQLTQNDSNQVKTNLLNQVKANQVMGSDQKQHKFGQEKKQREQQNTRPISGSDLCGTRPSAVREHRNNNAHVPLSSRGIKGLFFFGYAS